MAKIPASLRLSPEEIDALMRREARVRIATLGPGEKINLTPMTFGWANGKVYIFGRGQKVVNLRRNPVATVLLDTGEAWRELQGVMLHGRARILETMAEEEGDADLAAARLNLGEKHGIRENGEIMPYPATASGRSRRWIVFEPDEVISWDNRRLPT